MVVPSLECSGIPFGITAGGLTLNSLSLFTDHPLLRVSLITSRLLPRVIQDHDEDDLPPRPLRPVPVSNQNSGMPPPPPPPPGPPPDAAGTAMGDEPPKERLHVRFAVETPEPRKSSVRLGQFAK